MHEKSLKLWKINAKIMFVMKEKELKRENFTLLKGLKNPVEERIWRICFEN